MGQVPIPVKDHSIPVSSRAHDHPFAPFLWLHTAIVKREADVAATMHRLIDENNPLDYAVIGVAMYELLCVETFLPREEEDLVQMLCKHTIMRQDIVQNQNTNAIFFTIKK